MACRHGPGKAKTQEMTYILAGGICNLIGDTDKERICNVKSSTVRGSAGALELLAQFWGFWNDLLEEGMSQLRK